MHQRQVIIISWLLLWSLTSSAQSVPKETRLIVSLRAASNLQPFVPTYTTLNGMYGFSHNTKPPLTLIYPDGSTKTVQPNPLRIGLDGGLKRVNPDKGRAWSVLIGADWGEQLYSSLYDRPFAYQRYTLTSWVAYVSYGQFGGAVAYYWTDVIPNRPGASAFLRLGASQSFSLRYVEPRQAIDQPFTFRFVEKGTGSVVEQKTYAKSNVSLLPEVGITYGWFEISLLASLPLQPAFTEQHTYLQNGRVVSQSEIAYRTGGVYGNIRLIPPGLRLSSRKRHRRVRPERSPSQPTSYSKGQLIRLNNVYFGASSAELLTDSYPELNRLIEQLREQPMLRIRLEGHTDLVGDPVLNQQLSEARVAAIQRYLVGKGIASGRVELKGYGATRPLKCNCLPPVGCPENRRVEFLIMNY